VRRISIPTPTFVQEWVESIDFRCINNEDYEHVQFNDDRFGRVLNKLFLVDRASLMTELVMFFVNEFNITLERLKKNLEKLKRPKISSGEDANPVVMTKRSIFQPLEETILQPKEDIRSIGFIPVRSVNGIANRQKREKHLKKVEQCLALLNGKINKRTLKTREAIEEAAQQIIEEHKLESIRNNVKRVILLPVKL
jgi:hypothetical protein